MPSAVSLNRSGSVEAPEDAAARLPLEHQARADGRGFVAISVRADDLLALYVVAAVTAKSSSVRWMWQGRAG